MTSDARAKYEPVTRNPVSCEIIIKSEPAFAEEEPEPFLGKLGNL
jgi:hypothetical protein